MHVKALTKIEILESNAVCYYVCGKSFQINALHNYSWLCWSLLLFHLQLWLYFVFLSIRFISVLVITCFPIWVLINFWVLFDFIVGFSGVMIYLFVCLTM